jgi:hypothetical protein
MQEAACIGAETAANLMSEFQGSLRPLRALRCGVLTPLLDTLTEGGLWTAWAMMDIGTHSVVARAGLVTFHLRLHAPQV